MSEQNKKPPTVRKKHIHITEFPDQQTGSTETMKTVETGSSDTDISNGTTDGVVNSMIDNTTGKKVVVVLPLVVYDTVKDNLSRYTHFLERMRNRLGTSGAGRPRIRNISGDEFAAYVVSIINDNLDLKQGGDSKDQKSLT